MRTSRLVVALGLFSCHAAVPEPSPAPRNDDAPLVIAMQAAQRRMHERYASTRAVIDGVVRSDLPAVRAAAEVVSTLDEPDALPRWQPYLAAVQAAARDIDQAGDLRAAANGTGRLATRCASCHVATHARLALGDPPASDDGASLAHQMRGHHRAAQQLWQGLIGPADERWAAGAQALSAMPFDIVAARDGAEFVGDIDDSARIRMFGRRALAARTNDERAAVFGDLLVTCAHCHAALRDR
ncbi:MAG TPA: hypothetical protein VFP84_11685 [Kofleriaceae bacterium]|nr:hypothetical protein [Kofleriaceae bacterium]